MPSICVSALSASSGGDVGRMSRCRSQWQRLDSFPHTDAETDTGDYRTCDMRLRRPPFCPLNYGGVRVRGEASGAGAASTAALNSIPADNAGDGHRRRPHPAHGSPAVASGGSTLFRVATNRRSSASAARRTRSSVTASIMSSGITRSSRWNNASRTT